MNKLKRATPILFPLISLAAGIYAQSIFTFSIYPILITLIISSLVLILLMIIRQNTYISKVFAATTFFTLGAFCFFTQIKNFKEPLKIIENKKLNLICKITDKRILPQKTKFDIAEILNINVTAVEELTCPAYSLICYSRYKTNFQIEDTIKLSNVKIKEVKNESLSDNTSFQNYLFKEGFLGSLFLTRNHSPILINRPKRSIFRWLWNLKTRIYNELAAKMDKQTFKYFGLIFLGNTQQLEITQMRETFNYWGLSHYLARSGLHIVLFILIWTFLFRFIPIRLRWKRIALILICLIYNLLSWSSIPFIRAFYVFLLIEGGKLLDLQTQFLHLLSIVCMLVLIFNPLQLFFLDFQLSFALTFTLSWTLRYFS